MECRKCSKDLTGQEHRMVAQWPFCFECFEELLAKPKAAPAPEPAPVVPSSEAPAPQDDEGEGAPSLGRRVSVSVGAGPEATAACRLCGTETPMGDLVHLGFWRFCQTCYADVVENPLPADDDGPTEPPPPRERIIPDAFVYVLCARCGRRIPERGTKPIDGEPHCPDCYHAVAPLAPLPDLAALAVPEPGSATGAPSEHACDSCGRQTAGERPLQVEGFSICRACLGSDPDLAVELARGRHKQRLQRLRDELG